MKKILVLGAGFIASHLPYDKITDRVYASEENIFGLLNKYKPEVLINTIGKTGRPNIDECEKKQTETYIANTVIPAILADQCDRLGIHMIHMGSGCVFSSQSPHIKTSFATPINNFTKALHNDTGWTEKDTPNPVSYYGKTKAALDAIISGLKNITILRLRMPVSSADHPRNLLNKLLQYPKVLEEPNSMTFMDDLVRAVEFVIDRELKGIYNVVSTLPITHSVLLDEYNKYIPHIYKKITVKDLDKMVIAQRSNCILSNTKLFMAGFNFKQTNIAIEETVKAFAGNFKQRNK
jgi:3,5-epimerase/4-reductase